MRSTLLCLLLLPLGTASLPAQDTLRPTWSIIRRSPAALGNAEAWSVDVGSDGSIYWATSQTGSGPLSGFDAVLYKLDPSGAEIWPSPFRFGEDYAQQIYTLILDGSRIYLGGRTCGNNSINLETCDMLLLSVDAGTGDTLWQKTWDRGYGYEETDGMAIDGNDLYVGGWSMGDTTDWDAAILRLDRSSGDVKWASQWGSTLADHQDGQFVVDDRYIYAAGLYGGGTNPIIFLKGFDGKALLAKFSKEDGAHVADTTFGHEASWANFENALGMTTDGAYLYVTGVTTVALNDNQIFVAKFDKDLHLIWRTEWGGAQTETARSIAVAPDGRIFVGGNTNSIGAGGYDGVLLELAQDGGITRYWTWGGIGDEDILDTRLRDGALYLSGRTTTGHTGKQYDAFLIKAPLPEIASSVEASSDAAPGATLTCSTSSGEGGATIRFSLPKAVHVSIDLFDIRGERVARLVDDDLTGGTHVRHWRALVRGVYLCRMVVGGAVRIGLLPMQ